MERQQILAILLGLIQRLRPIDKQVILLYLEGLDAFSTAEITGISAAHVAVKVNRIKMLLSRLFKQGAAHAK